MKASHLSAHMICSFLLDAENDVSRLMNDLVNDAQLKTRSLIIDPVVVSECCSVIESEINGITKAEIADALTRFIVLDGVRCNDKESVLNALEIYSRLDIKFADAWVVNRTNEPVPSIKRGTPKVVDDNQSTLLITSVGETNE